MDHTQLFTTKAGYYRKYRPSYAEGFFTEMQRRKILTAGKTVADIGAGTGILSKQLRKSGAEVFAVEPNAGMRSAAEIFLKDTGVQIFSGSAENTGLKDASVDTVFAGQAFHWFAPELFRKECARILKENGQVIIVYNRRVPGAMEDERKKIVSTYVPDLENYHSNWDKRLAAIDRFFRGQYEELSFEHDLEETEEAFIGRSLSVSHAPDDDDPLFAQYVKDWKTYFDRYQKDGLLTTENVTAAFIGEVSLE